jgi:Flp pilus assembly protein TadG
MLGMGIRLLGSAARLVRFGRDRRGSITIEMGFAAIAFTMLVTGVDSFGSILFVQANMMNAARDTARSMAVGAIAGTQPAAQTYATARMINWGIVYTVVPTYPGAIGGDVVIEITAPMSDAALIDYLNLFGGKTLRAKVTTRREV